MARPSLPAAAPPPPPPREATVRASKYVADVTECLKVGDAEGAAKALENVAAAGDAHYSLCVFDAAADKHTKRKLAWGEGSGAAGDKIQARRRAAWAGGGGVGEGGGHVSVWAAYVARREFRASASRAWVYVAPKRVPTKTDEDPPPPARRRAGPLTTHASSPAHEGTTTAVVRLRPPDSPNPTRTTLAPTHHRPAHTPLAGVARRGGRRRSG